MSNVLAAIGRGQLGVLDERVRRKWEIFEYYRAALGDVAGIEFMPEAGYGRCNPWLTVILITPEVFGADREAVRMALEAENIESRPVWKPMHMQPVFCGSRKDAKGKEERQLGRADDRGWQSGGGGNRDIPRGWLAGLWRKNFLKKGCVCLPEPR